MPPRADDGGETNVGSLQHLHELGQLPTPPYQGVLRRREPDPCDRSCPGWGEVGPEPRGPHLEELLDAGETLQGEGAKVLDLPSRGLGLPLDQLPDRGGHDDLPAVGGGGNP